jgi:hypothetical protein
MTSCSQALHVCAYSLRKLATDYRLWISIVLLLALTHMFTEGYGQFCQAVDMKMSPWVFPFLYNSKYVKILFFAPLLLLFCDAPFIDSTQPYVICRSGRIAWSVGQLLYIVVLSALYFLFLLAVSCLFILGSVEPSLEWGKVLGTLANTDAAGKLDLLCFVNNQVLSYFTPLQATWFTFLLSWLVGIFLGFVIYALNSLTGTRSLGVVAAAFFLVLDSAVVGIPLLIRWSPVSWSSISNIGIGEFSLYPSYPYVMAVLLVALGILAVLSVVANKKQQIVVQQPV